MRALRLETVSETGVRLGYEEQARVVRGRGLLTPGRDEGDKRLL